MNISKLPSLSESLLTALDFHSQEAIAKFPKLKKGLKIVVGSGNAYNTAKIIFADQVVLFASESNFLSVLESSKTLIKNKVITEAVIISASGEKDAIWEVEEAKKNHLKTILLTCSPHSSAAKLADTVVVYRKTAEPQTYNISTYLGMILSKTKEDPAIIKKFIKKIVLPKNFSRYQAFSFILPDKFSALTPMLTIKKHELFGSMLSIRPFSHGDARHAKFVIPSARELVISLGENKYFGLSQHRWQIKMPKEYDYGLAFSLCYYLIGQIQEQKPPYYQKNIAKYCQTGPLAYGKKEPFPIIVE